VIDLLQKLLVYEPQKRLNALEIMAHPFFDELRNSESTNNGKFIIPQIFDFTESK
jgi:serine/threonine protein kinase